MKQRGFTLIELLMVLVGMAVILLFSIHRYRIYHRSIEMAGVKNDIKSVQQALNRYYHVEGCDIKGLFPDDKRTPSMTELGLDVPGRPPIVPIANDAYVAKVVKVVDTQKKSKEDKPLYALRVQAKLNTNYTDKEMMWYQQALGAESVSSHTLTWVVLPSNTAAAPGTRLWILKSEAEQFRKMENKLGQNAGLKLDHSSSYCAH